MATAVPGVVTRKPKVLVLDGEQRSSLAAVRSLGRSAADVFVAGSDAQAIAARSRYSTAMLAVPDPSEDADAFLAAVLAHVDRLEVDFVLPMTDSSVMLAAGLRHAHMRVLAPPCDVYERVTDKVALVNMAAHHGVRVPEGIVVSSRAEVRSAARHFGYPFVLKPGRSKYLQSRRVVSTGVRIVNSAAELDAALEHSAWLDHIQGLVQRFVPGKGAGVFTLYGIDGAIAWFAHRRLREKPPAGGVSVLSMSAMPDPRVKEDARRLLDAAGWWGPAMVEFRVTPEGTPYLMEINGRFWGSLQLAVDSGVDFPTMLLRSAAGQKVQPLDSYATGKRLRWLLGDVDHLLLQWRRDCPVSQKISSTMGFLGAFLDPRVRQELFRWSDPGPAKAEFVRWVREALA